MKKLTYWLKKEKQKQDHSICWRWRSTTEGMNFTLVSVIILIRKRTVLLIQSFEILDYSNCTKSKYLNK